MLAAGCGGGAGTAAQAASRAVQPPDPHTRYALISIAVAFNTNYAENRDGLVYDRWDSASQATITRAEYVRRHKRCPTAPGPAVVESATPISGGFWRVRYAISGSQLVDYWQYVGGRWVFDLARSNPDAVKLYRLSFTAYARAVGCRSH